MVYSEGDGRAVFNENHESQEWVDLRKGEISKRHLQ